MKYNMIKNAGVVLAFGLCATSCNDFLDEKPTSNIFPDVYFSDASHLEAYANNLYVEFFAFSYDCGRLWDTWKR